MPVPPVTWETDEPDELETPEADAKAIAAAAVDDTVATLGTLAGSKSGAQAIAALILRARLWRA